MTAAAAAGLGIFGAAALGLVALLAFWLGRQVGRSQAPSAHLPWAAGPAAGTAPSTPPPGARRDDRPALPAGESAGTPPVEAPEADLPITISAEGGASGASASLRAAAALLLPALRAVPCPVLVLWDRGEGLALAELNPAAQQRWPALAAGTPLQALTDEPARLPVEVLQALEQAGAAPLPAEVAGWQVAATPPLAGAGRGVVLAWGGRADGSAESDHFSFAVTHDLRAPIRVVEGFTRIVKEDYGSLLDRVGHDHLDRVLSAAARMNLMIDALLTLARLSTQPLARQTVNLSQLAGWVVEELRRAAPEREADVDIEAGLTAIGDPTLLRLVLENLLGNAWKYSARTARAQISLRQVPHGGGRAFAVRDNGAGFDMRSADRLFGLFQRLHGASEFAGHGVGLASVQRIVRRHGGSVWAESEPGRGATFYFTLG